LVTGKSRPSNEQLLLADASIAVAAARFNQKIVDGLLEGALCALRDHGLSGSDVRVVRVPGAFELPLATQVLARTRRYDAIVALGAVIRGDTPHFEYVCRECSRGLSRVSLAFDVPVGFGVLTCDTVAQATARSVVGGDNKGKDAALAAIEMVRLLRQLGS